MDLSMIPYELITYITQFISARDFCRMLCTCKFMLQWFCERKKMGIINIGMNLQFRICESMWASHIETVITTSDLLANLGQLACSKAPCITIKNMQINCNSTNLRLDCFNFIETLIIHNYIPYPDHTFCKLDNFYIYGNPNTFLHFEAIDTKFVVPSVMKKLCIHSGMRCKDYGCECFACKNGTYISSVIVTNVLEFYGYSDKNIKITRFIVPNSRKRDVEFYTDLQAREIDATVFLSFRKVHTNCTCEYKFCI